MSSTTTSRRTFLATIPIAGAGLGGLAAAEGRRGHREPQDSAIPAVHDSFPAQHPDLVRETVAVSHGNFERVKELVEARPALAKASWDWGFGDHETALGAASHVGNRDIALYLIEKGAAPTIFSAAMLGQLDVVRAMVESFRSVPGIEVQRIAGPHGIPLLAHAEMGGEEATAVLEYLTSLGGANERPATVEISDEDRAKCAGTYSFGEGANDRFIVADERGSLRIKLGEQGNGRGLTHRGNFEFSPAGAPEVRISFDVQGAEVVRLRVIDGDFVLEAAKS